MFTLENWINQVIPYGSIGGKEGMLLDFVSLYSIIE
jgi:hypothetical protein